jgi:hypothetical protein
MRSNTLKATLSKTVLAVAILLLGAGVSFAQTVNLTAASANAIMPDGQAVPMWGYTCSAAAVAPATCAAANPNASAAWSPVVITVPPGPLTINLTNSLPAPVPTSLVIVGQLGGGLGVVAQRTTQPSPDHSTPQDTTWPIAATGPQFTPPGQAARVQSFTTEVANGATTTLTWGVGTGAPPLKPGTYLIESGTHPSIQGPMGLYGVLVVTTAPTTTPGTAYPGVPYDADIPLVLSEIDPVQNNAVANAVINPAFSETAVWSGQPGQCGNSASSNFGACYPPAVNYDPRYYLINGVAFNKASIAGSQFPIGSSLTAPAGTGRILVRFVNAGLRMHVPAIVGASTGATPVPGLGLIAEDGNVLPGVVRVQNEVFMAAGKTYDVLVNAPTVATNLPVFDRQLSLSANNQRDGGMLAYINVNGAGAISGAGAAVARADTYFCTPGVPLTISDPAKGLIANDTNVYGVTLSGTVTPTTNFVTLNPDGTFTYQTSTGGCSPGTFHYIANGSSTITATVSIQNCTGACLGTGPVAVADTYSANNIANSVHVAPPGVLANDSDPQGRSLCAISPTITPTSCAAAVAAGPVSITAGTATLMLNPDGSFTATRTSGTTSTATVTFTYRAMNEQHQASGVANIMVTFPAASGLVVSVVDGQDKSTPITDYRWVIEEDRTFYVDPTKTTNNGGSTIVPTFGTNFHTSYMPVVATGCTGDLSCESGQTLLGAGAVCDIGNGACRPGVEKTQLDPGMVHLDPTKRYYISILPGDAAASFENINGCLGNATPSCGHGMGGAPITFGQTAVTILAQPNPFPPSQLSVFVFEDDFPLNGEQDAGGGIDVLATNEPGLGGFNITLFDDAGGTGDATGQMTYDMFNMPLSNSLAGTIDPATGNDTCPISKISRIGVNDPTQTGITGTIVTCPRFESDGVTLSPLAGQAVVANLMPGRYGVVATPAADRIGRGEEWLQTNTLDGQKAHDSFLRIGEPSFFQEFGPAGYHVSIGFANPSVINARKAGVCNGTDPNVTGVTGCGSTVTGVITTERMSRTPDERLYSSGDNSGFSFTQCYVSFGDTDGEDFAFTKCNPDGTFSIGGLPNSGTWRVTVFDQWNDMLVDGLSTPVALNGGTTNLGQIAMNQWQANLYTKTFFDLNNDGIQDNGEAGLTLVATNIRFRDGSYSNFNNTDLSGNAGFNEVFPLFSWYVVETDTTRYKSTGVHVVYDAGGPADTAANTIGQSLANTTEQIPVPSNLRVPGARYCALADCPPGDSNGGSTGRVDPPWVATEGWQGFSGQNSFIEFGKKPYAAATNTTPAETGGIHGEVIYASTRPFDDPALLIHTSWTPDVPGVKINLYQEVTANDGTTGLHLIDTTTTSSWDDWAQGFRSNGVPNMNCPGQGRDTGTNADLFFFTLFNQPSYLDVYNNQHNGTPLHPIPNNSQFKCYDGMHNWNQVQPAPYDGMYSFPSVLSINPTTGAPAGTNCVMASTTQPWGCVPNPDATDNYRHNTPMLAPGKYVVEMIVPPGYELVKEEDKNILIGDNYIAPATQQFGGLGSIFILPDQAEVGAAYNANNPQNPTVDLGATPRHEGDTGSVETFWPCVGQSRVVPDFISLFPQSGEVAPFAGATRNLCDRKEVTLTAQTSALAKFWIFTSAHVAAHFTGVITDDFTSEFDPFSPQFGEKFSPPNMPISIKDWTGAEISRVYTDQWGTYDGLTYSTWEVNPPNPTGYAPQMMVTCMNDPGTGATPDPLFNPQYSQFCYEIPFMPGQTQYMDTPVVPTSAFAGAGYNNPDCAYPDATPAIASVNGDGAGPWVSAAGHTLTITALGNQTVPNNAYSGPSATGAPFNQKTAARHYGFGAPGTAALVGSDGVPHLLTGVSWSDTTITGTVPTGVPDCAIQQQAQYGGSNAQCGELVITTSTGKTSVDTVMVTIGGKAPVRVSPNATATTNNPFGPIQAAINAAAPGDLIIVNPGVYNEMLLMWKPVRLQGVGAASSILNANSHPAGRMQPWRQTVNCLFGLALNGQPYSTAGHLVPKPGGGGNEPLNPYDSTGALSCPATGWNYFFGSPNNPQVDRIPLEGILGWDTTLNGNLAELLQEPTLMGAYEGAGITVLAKGVRYPNGVEVFGAASDAEANANVAHEGQMPAIVNADGTLHGTIMLTNSDADCLTGGTSTTGYSSNFMCNPSRIDGLSITNSSQGGGGIFVHGWAHNLEIANNRVYNNTGTLTGGITVGQGESPDALLAGNEGNPVGFDQQPWTCNVLIPGAEIPGATTNQNVSPPGVATNTQLPYCYNENVRVHHNAVTGNSSIGDELFSSTPAGAGGVTFAVGADLYQFRNNWVCGNLSTGDGGGLSQLGFSYHGDIEHNSILFNQSTNPTVPANGGGVVIMGAAPDGSPTIPQAGVTECGSVTDVDCAPGLSDGTGPGLVINANLIMGNGADSGSGGGIRLQDINGTEVPLFPTLPLASPGLSPGWNSVTLTNNIITNNVAGWDGAGVSLQDALVANLINNTIVSNDTTASSGVLFNTNGATLASTPGDPNQTQSLTASAPQPAGVVTMRNTALLSAAIPGTVVCPPGHGTGTTCKNFSVPLLYNDVIWQNRSFYIGVGPLGAGTQNQQNTVALYNAFTTNQVASEPTTDATAGNGGGVIVTGGTGACVTGTSYWEIGARGDTGPANHGSGVILAPLYSVLTDAADYPGGNNSASNPTVLSQYCNGSRTPPEFKSLGYQVPPGISDATVPNPIFNLTPAATVDEGNNWINISWGPLALTNTSNGANNGTLLGNYALASGSPAIDYIPLGQPTAAVAPPTDFFGNPRPATPGTNIDVGAVEFVGGTTGGAVASVTGGPLAFGNVAVGTNSTPMTLTLHNNGSANLTGIGTVFSSPRYSRPGGVAGGTCTGTLAANSTCTINVVFHPTALGLVNATLTINASVPVTGSPVTLSGTGARGAVTFGLGTGTTTGVALVPIFGVQTLSFGTQTPGTTATAVVTLTNTGQAPTTYTASAVSGGAGHFAKGTDTCTGPTPVAVGGVCSITVTFNPNNANIRVGMLRVTDNATGSPQILPLMGQ